MNAPSALWRIAHPGNGLDGEYVCAVCGGPAGPRWSSASIMADTFQRYDVFRRPDASHVCDACAWYLDESGKRTGEPHDAFRKMSYIVLPNRWRSVAAPDVRALLRRHPAGPPYPLYLVLSRQKKKHLALLARPWLAGSRLVAQWEETTIDVDRRAFEGIRLHIRALLDAGVGKMAILSGQIPTLALRKHPDVAPLLLHNLALGAWRPSAPLEMAVWLAQSPERGST